MIGGLPQTTPADVLRHREQLSHAGLHADHFADGGFRHSGPGIGAAGVTSDTAHAQQRWRKWKANVLWQTGFAEIHDNTTATA
jgi:hypothetical protein